MKRKNMSKIATTVVLITVLLSSVSCSNDRYTIPEEQSITLATEEKEQISTDISSAELEDELASSILEPDYMTTEGFITAEEASEQYVFQEEHTRVDSDNSYWYTERTFKGNYPLSGDDEADITVYCDNETFESYIEIEGIKMDMYVTYVDNVTIIDVDESDDYKEVAVYDSGASGDPTIILYRYCDGEICEIGSFFGHYDYNMVLFDKKGMIIESTGYIDFLDEQIVTDFYMVEGDTAVESAIDFSAALNKTYTLTKDIYVAFAETDNEDLDAAYDVISLDNITLLEQGTELLLINADAASAVFCVQLQDGTKGVFTTWIAG